MKPVQLTAAAKTDIKQAATWYEAKREGLGGEFIDRVIEAIGIIETNPEAFRIVHKGLRRVQINRFKDYALWYQVRPDDSIVVACLSGRMHPALVKERASGVIPFPKGPEPA